jgi:NADH:ubiquinone oxidoreductase subunit D
MARPAQLARTLFAELERLNSALWTLGEIARAVDQRRLWSVALEQRERVFEAARAATGERVFWGVARPGGVRAGLALAPVRTFAEGATGIYEEWRQAVAPGGALRKATEGLGRPPEGATSAGAEGADGAEAARVNAEDARRAAPYDAYRMMTLDWDPLDELDAGATDVTTRAARLVAGMKLSVDIMATCAEELEGEPELGAAAIKLLAGEGSALAQSPHGPARVSVTLDGAGTVESLRLETPCAEMIARAPGLLMGHALGEAPALLAALDLCPACAEL